jgi:hypothetical protein
VHGHSRGNEAGARGGATNLVDKVGVELQEEDLCALVGPNRACRTLNAEDGASELLPQLRLESVESDCDVPSNHNPLEIDENCRGLTRDGFQLTSRAEEE